MASRDGARRRPDSPRAVERRHLKYRHIHQRPAHSCLAVDEAPGGAAPNTAPFPPSIVPLRLPPSDGLSGPRLGAFGISASPTGRATLRQPAPTGWAGRGR
ncbi:hypothetical protein GCM10010245_52170 [Streptomyces spectabilis]|nr:hypothetical protein GCM10010245_52170 [Streptomyces spectabilis]